ncbi:MAG: hypothetical protein H8D71_01675 [Deltaproteobacteria bacterium]|jgi:hypothetical protein|nr:hypothetical protein [Deltaproteobacteria bacterium]
MESVDTLISTLQAAPHDKRDSIKKALLALALGDNGSTVREHLQSIKRGALLELQWEIEDILEESAPPPIEPPPSAEPPKAPPEPEPEPEPVDPNAPLTAADLDLVYDDPRGLMLHKSKVGDRWFATQVDPQTGQPQTFELHAHELEQLKTQLQGSPNWRIGV